MEYDLIIIGAGPAGYVAAIRAGQVGLKTALIEKQHIGGMCLNWGCIPSKAILEIAKYYNELKNASQYGIDGIDENNISFNWEKTKKRALGIVKKLTGRVDYLLTKNGIDVIIGEANITSNNSVSVSNRNIEAENIIIATGSYPGNIEGNIEGLKVVSLDKLFELKEIPDNIVIVGHGAVTVEMAQFFRLIDKNVSIIATNENLLPKIDNYLSDYILKKVLSDGIKIIKSNAIDTGIGNGDIKIGDNSIKCDMLLNCSWRKATIPHSNIEIEKTESGYINTNEYLQTNHPNIYAVGEVNGKSSLAHVASAQGLYVVNNIKGVKGSINLKNYPINIYTYPEIAQIGSTEQDLVDSKIDYKISEFPLSANGKALIEGKEEGFIRMISEKKYGEVLGVQIIAHDATDLISEAAAFMSVEASIYDIAKTIHAHPTVSEVFMEAGFEAIDKAIHK